MRYFLKIFSLAFTIIFCLHQSSQAQDEHVPYLISNGGDVQTDGNITVHLAIGEPVVTFNDGAEYIGLGFLQALARSIPCPPDDRDCLCERSPDDPLCAEFELNNFNFLLNPENEIVPPPTLQIDGSFHLTVFNRWGKQEFSTLDQDEITTWEGVNNEGLLLDNGVYFYVLEHPGCQDGKCKGSVTILR